MSSPCTHTIVMVRIIAPEKLIFKVAVGALIKKYLRSEVALKLGWLLVIRTSL